MKPSRQEQVIRGIGFIQRGTHFDVTDLKHQMVESRLQTPTTNELAYVLRVLDKKGWVQTTDKVRAGYIYIHGWRWNVDA